MNEREALIAALGAGPMGPALMEQLMHAMAMQQARPITQRGIQDNMKPGMRGNLVSGSQQNMDLWR